MKYLNHNLNSEHHLMFIANSLLMIDMLSWDYIALKM